MRIKYNDKYLEILLCHYNLTNDKQRAAYDICIGRRSFSSLLVYYT